MSSGGSRRGAGEQCRIIPSVVKFFQDRPFRWKILQKGEPDQNRIVPSVEKFPKSWVRSTSWHAQIEVSVPRVHVVKFLLTKNLAMTLKFLVACRSICHWVAGCLCCHRCFRRAQFRQLLRPPQLPTVLSPTVAEAGRAALDGDQRHRSLFASSPPAAPFVCPDFDTLPKTCSAAQEDGSAPTGKCSCRFQWDEACPDPVGVALRCV